MWVGRRSRSWTGRKVWKCPERIWRITALPARHFSDGRLGPVHDVVELICGGRASTQGVLWGGFGLVEGVAEIGEHV